MTVTDQLKTLDRKIMSNKAQYDLDREAAKISALSSKELDKYEYLAGDNLGYKPSVLEKAKFEYSPLGRVFNKGLDKEDKKEGLLKRLKNLESKNEEQLREIKDQGKRQLHEIKNKSNDTKVLKAIRFFSNLSQAAKELLDKIKKEKNNINPEKLVCVHTNRTFYDFNIFKSSLAFASSIYSSKISWKEAENKQYKC